MRCRGSRLLARGTGMFSMSAPADRLRLLLAGAIGMTSAASAPAIGAAKACSCAGVLLPPLTLAIMFLAASIQPP